MEHSEEYYKMKYFKYKAKYIQEKQRLEQSGKGKVIQGVGNIAKGVSQIATAVTPTIFRGDAKKEALRKAFEFYINHKQTAIKGAIDSTKEKEIWNKVTKYSGFENKFNELENLNATEKAELKEIKENLYKWCKNTVYLTNEIDEKCKL